MSRGTLTLLAARADGSVTIGPDDSPPTTTLTTGSNLDTAVHAMNDALRLDPGATLLAVADTTTQGLVHHVAWHGTLPASWNPPAPWRTVPFGEVLATLAPTVAGRLRAASRAGILGKRTVHLHDGLRPGARPTKSERTAAQFTWHARTPTAEEDERVRQVWGWLTDACGRVLVVVDRHGAPGLPGGCPEPGESRSATLARETLEEAAAHHGQPAVLGFQHVTEAGRAPYLQLRMTAPLLDVGPAAPDPDNGEIYQRVLVPAAQANLLLGWGPEGDAQAAAVASAFPRAHDCALRHVPEHGWMPEGACQAGSVS
ncbi:NUDIX domain-containing protein [Streptomyces sp. NBC_01571]|uniref:NUDIX domain-containing protein n=1 Tax=Streptomyces sp. NBC_01571 TaxID=2975883 RepID=UPI00225885B6|nr:NUDIX domain-containing protein [Streptomyces sp. NBC_01571]MCX4581286.1 NUDIX domain-containing protein [Streptomyces sp. NBC_01571]